MKSILVIFAAFLLSGPTWALAGEGTPASAPAGEAAPASAPSPETRPAKWKDRTPERAYRGRFRGELRGSFAIVDKNGVPDALRTGGALGVMFFDRGPLGLAVDGSFLIGHSEQAGWSLRAGGNLEAEWMFHTVRTSAYVTTGLHYFMSRSTENRSGLLWRGGVGARFMLGRWYIAVEPFAIERLPNGEGEHTPLRSRWVWELTFLAVGYRP